MIIKMAPQMKKKISFCYKAKNVFNSNNEFTLDNSIYENHKCGDHGYRCEY